MEKLIKQFKKYWFFFGLLLLTLTIVGIDSWTKYVTEKQEDGIVKAVEMFFASDVLKEDGASSQEPDYTIVDWKDDSKITFELRNYPDSKRFTNRPISFVLSDGANNKYAVFDHTNVEPDGSGTIPASNSSSDRKSKQITFTLTKEFWSEAPKAIVNGVEGQVLTITATTTSPYEGYQVSAKFLIKKAVEENYQVIIEDGPDSPYTTVTINANTALNLTLTWDDSVVVPDQTNSILKKDIGSDPTAFGNKGGKTIGLNTIADGGSVTFLMLKYDTSVSYIEKPYTEAFTISPSP